MGTNTSYFRTKNKIPKYVLWAKAYRSQLGIVIKEKNPEKKAEKGNKVFQNKSYLLQL